MFLSLVLKAATTTEIDTTAVTVAAISALSAIAVATLTVGLPVFFVARSRASTRKAERGAYRDKVDAIHESTVNSHPTILRDDVDNIQNSIQTLTDMMTLSMVKLSRISGRINTQSRLSRENSRAIEEAVRRIAALEGPARQNEELL